MAKQKEVKIIRPSEATASLIEFNNRVIALTNLVSLAVEKDLIDPRIKTEIDDCNKQVKEFYKD